MFKASARRAGEQAAAKMMTDAIYTSLRESAHLSESVESDVQSNPGSVGSEGVETPKRGGKIDKASDEDTSCSI